jgi:hypothetical protein
VYSYKEKRGVTRINESYRRASSGITNDKIAKYSGASLRKKIHGSSFAVSLLFEVYYRCTFAPPTQQVMVRTCYTIPYLIYFPSITAIYYSGVCGSIRGKEKVHG